MRKEFAMIDFEFEFQYAEAKLPILRQVGGGIPAGRCVVLCGGSGCGKSTLLRCINGLIPQFYEGELKGFCRLNGQDTAGISIGEIGELAASVFQDPRSQFFTVNSSNEVAFGLENLGLPQSPENHGRDSFPSSSCLRPSFHEALLFIPAVAVWAAGGEGVLPHKISRAARFAHGVVQMAQRGSEVI